MTAVQTSTLLVVALGAAMVALTMTCAGRRLKRLRNSATSLVAAAATLIYGAVILLTWPRITGTGFDRWFSNRTTAIQISLEIIPLALLSLAVVVGRRVSRGHLIVILLTLVLCLGSLAVTNHIMLLGVVSDVIRDDVGPLPHGWGIHTPPGNRFAGYAVAVFLAVFAALTWDSRKRAVDEMFEAGRDSSKPVSTRTVS